MAYTILSNVNDGDIEFASMYNALIANVAACYQPPSSSYKANEVSDYTTSSSSFADVDNNGGVADGKFFRRITLDATGDILVGFTGIFATIVTSGGPARISVDFTVNGTRYIGDDGILVSESGATSTAVQPAIAFVYLLEDQPAGTYDFKLQWKISGGVGPIATLYAGAGTANRDFHPGFFAKQV